MNTPSYAIITGASGGIGSAFARQLLTRGYIVYLQYRSQEALVKLQESFKDTATQVRFFPSDLKDKKKLEEFLRGCKEQNIYFSVAVLAAGTWSADSSFPNTDTAISALDATNFQTKEVFVQAFSAVYADQEIPTHLFLISSHVSDLDDTQAKKWDQMGYVASMRQVNALAERISSVPAEFGKALKAHLLKTKQVETNLLKGVREKNPDVVAGMDPDQYAEAELNKGGL
jgi:short-subunit dehydrogenase